MSSASYKRYVLCVLTLVYTLNYLDRGLITLLLPDIQADLRLSDTQLGFLTGIAFGLFYATVGIPVARWSDRGNRVTITSLAIGLWGMTVMSCILVTSFLQLVAARVAAAVGEAGCMPPTYSLVGDYFPGQSERTRAMAFYMLASPLSVLLSFVGGGWLASRAGWRMTFVLMGIPALVIAVLVRLTIRDPRTAKHSARATTQTLPRLDRILTDFWRVRAVRHLTLAMIVLLTIGAGLGPWYATFLTRYHGFATDSLGYYLGAIFSVAGFGGISLGGYLSTRLFAHDEPGQMKMIAVAVACLFPSFVLFLLSRSSTAALCALAILWMLFNFSIAPTFALLQRLVPAETRATSMAVVMMLSNLIGMGLGPQVVGLLSDALIPTLGTDSLRYSMLTLSVAAFWSAYHFWQIGRHLTLIGSDAVVNA